MKILFCLKRVEFFAKEHNLEERSNPFKRSWTIKPFQIFFIELLTNTEIKQMTHIGESIFHALDFVIKYNEKRLDKKLTECVLFIQNY